MLFSRIKSFLQELKLQDPAFPGVTSPVMSRLQEFKDFVKIKFSACKNLDVMAHQKNSRMAEEANRNRKLEPWEPFFQKPREELEPSEPFFSGTETGTGTAPLR